LIVTLWLVPHFQLRRTEAVPLPIKADQRTLTVLAQERCCAGKLLGRKIDEFYCQKESASVGSHQYAIMAELLPQSGETSKHFNLVLRETVLKSGEPRPLANQQPGIEITYRTWKACIYLD
jgi:hypothetical protein